MSEYITYLISLYKGKVILDYFEHTNLAKGLDKSYLRVIFFSPSLNEKISDIGLLSSSARNDPIFTELSNEGVSRALIQIL